MTLTLDASVIVKWLVQEPKFEPDKDKASALVKRIFDGLDAVIQPPHWLAEVASEGVLITADERYFSKAKKYGRISSLRAWTQS